LTLLLASFSNRSVRSLKRSLDRSEIFGLVSKTPVLGLHHNGVGFEVLPTCSCLTLPAGP